MKKIYRKPETYIYDYDSGREIASSEDYAKHITGKIKNLEVYKADGRAFEEEGHEK